MSHLPCLDTQGGHALPDHGDPAPVGRIPCSLPRPCLGWQPCSRFRPAPPGPGPMRHSQPWQARPGHSCAVPATVAGRVAAARPGLCPRLSAARRGTARVLDGRCGHLQLAAGPVEVSRAASADACAHVVERHALGIAVSGVQAVVTDAPWLNERLRLATPLPGSASLRYGRGFGSFV